MGKLIFITTILTTSLFFTGCQFKQTGNSESSAIITQPSTKPATSTEVVTMTSDLELKLVASQDGQTAFDLLKANAEIETKQYDFGVFIESINGKKGDDQHFWALYVNEQKAEAGAKQTILKKGDLVKWVWEEIKL